MEFAISPWKLKISQIVWSLGISCRLNYIVCCAKNGPQLHCLLGGIGEVVEGHVFSKNPNEAMAATLPTLLQAEALPK